MRYNVSQMSFMCKFRTQNLLQIILLGLLTYRKSEVLEFNFQFSLSMFLCKDTYIEHSQQWCNITILLYFSSSNPKIILTAVELNL